MINVLKCCFQVVCAENCELTPTRPVTRPSTCERWCRLPSRKGNRSSVQLQAPNTQHTEADGLRKETCRSDACRYRFKKNGFIDQHWSQSRESICCGKKQRFACELPKEAWQSCGSSNIHVSHTTKKDALGGARCNSVCGKKSNPCLFRNRQVPPSELLRRLPRKGARQWRWEFRVWGLCEKPEHPSAIPYRTFGVDVWARVCAARCLQRRSNAVVASMMCCAWSEEARPSRAPRPRIPTPANPQFNASGFSAALSPFFSTK